MKFKYLLFWVDDTGEHISGTNDESRAKLLARLGHVTVINCEIGERLLLTAPNGVSISTTPVELRTLETFPIDEL